VYTSSNKSFKAAITPGYGLEEERNSRGQRLKKYTVKPSIPTGLLPLSFFLSLSLSLEAEREREP